jgi:peptide/nickel transport system ATP-binding protein
MGSDKRPIQKDGPNVPKDGPNVRRAGPSGPANEPLLEVRDLRTHFFTREGVVRSVDGVSFSIRPGQTVGIVGESGCGKSITAKSILRIVERPGRIVGGEILFRRDRGIVDLAQLGEDSAEIRSVRGAEISLIFQEPMSSFSPVHTIGAQMTEMTRHHWRLSKQQAREHAVEMLHKVGVSRPETRVNQYSYELSGGMRQRAMIALALSCNPRILIADEPTTSLDVTTQAQILDLLRQLQAETGMAVMLITHNLGVVAEMCEHVVVMYLGRVVEQGPVDQIFHAPKHPYTKALLESIPSMALPSRMKLPTISGSIPHPYNRPGGCPFHPRCPSHMPGICDAREPGIAILGKDHSAACFLHEEAKETVVVL